MKYLFSMTLIAAAVVSVLSSRAQITSGTVMRHIASVGARQTVVDYFEKPEWVVIKKGVASGSDNWLKVYVALVPVADAGAGEDLGEAIFEALPVRPFKVLPILSNNGQRKIEELCSFTFEAGIPDGGINAYLTHLEQSLLKADDQSKRAMADSCRLGIKVTRDAFKNSPGY